MCKYEGNAGKRKISCSLNLLLHKLNFMLFHSSAVKRKTYFVLNNNTVFFRYLNRDSQSGVENLWSAAQTTVSRNIEQQMLTFGSDPRRLL